MTDFLEKEIHDSVEINSSTELQIKSTTWYRHHSLTIEINLSVDNSQTTKFDIQVNHSLPFRKRQLLAVCYNVANIRSSYKRVQNSKSLAGFLWTKRCSPICTERVRAAPGRRIRSLNATKHPGILRGKIWLVIVSGRMTKRKKRP